MRLACTIFRVSHTCYRYTAKRCVENEKIDRWLMRLTDNYRPLDPTSERRQIWEDYRAIFGKKKLVPIT